MTATGAFWNTWIYTQRMWIAVYVVEACLFMQTTRLLGFKPYRNWGEKMKWKWKGQSREVMSYWRQYSPLKEFNYKPYWVLKTVAALKAYNTPFQMSSGWPGTLCLRAVMLTAGAGAPLPAVPQMDATFQVNSLLL